MKWWSFLCNKPEMPEQAHSLRSFIQDMHIWQKFNQCYRSLSTHSPCLMRGMWVCLCFNMRLSISCMSTCFFFNFCLNPNHNYFRWVFHYAWTFRTWIFWILNAGSKWVRSRCKDFESFFFTDSKSRCICLRVSEWVSDFVCKWCKFIL